MGLALDKVWELSRTGRFPLTKLWWHGRGTQGSERLGASSPPHTEVAVACLHHSGCLEQRGEAESINATPGEVVTHPVRHARGGGSMGPQPQGLFTL